MTTLASNVLRLRLDEIVESPLNPRTHFDAEELRAFGRRLRAQGQKELIAVRALPDGRYELANGARRLRAARLEGLDTLDARVEAYTDEQIIELGLATGTDAQPLTPIEQASGYRRLMEMRGWTQQQLAEELGLDQPEVSKLVSLLELPVAAREAVEAGKLKVQTAALIARIPGEGERKAATKEVLHPETQEEPLSYRSARALIEARYCRSLAGAPFDPKDAKLLPAAGACTACPWRAGNNPEIYGDVGNPHTCMRPFCYAEKAAAARERVAARLVKEGRRMLSAEENETAFPAEAAGLSPRSEFVEFMKPVPRDLLKAEVVQPGPKWCELCVGRVSVQVYAGFDQAGRVVELVKVAEAVLAVSENDHPIFSDAARRRYGLGKDDVPLSAAADPGFVPSSARSAANAGKRPKLINQEERDNDLVDRFAAALKDHLAELRASGDVWWWENPPENGPKFFTSSAVCALADGELIEGAMLTAFAWHHQATNKKE